jgi:hypothetical protein
VNEMLNLWCLYHVGNFLKQLSGCQLAARVRGFVQSAGLSGPGFGWTRNTGFLVEKCERKKPPGRWWLTCELMLKICPSIL